MKRLNIFTKYHFSFEVISIIVIWVSQASQASLDSDSQPAP